MILHRNSNPRSTLSLCAVALVLASVAAAPSAAALEATLQILDGQTKEPLTAWCELFDPSGKHLFPVDDKIRGEHEPPFFYVWDTFKVEVKTDVVYTLKIRKGLGWFPFEEKFEFREGHDHVIVSMNAWYRPIDRAWIAGDLEGRWSFSDPSLPMAAWDLFAAFRIVDATAAMADYERLSAGVVHLPGGRGYSGRDWGFGDFNVIRTAKEPPVHETEFRQTGLDEMFVAKNLGGLVDVVNSESRDMPVAAAHDLIASIRVLGPDGPSDDKTWEMDRILARLERYYDFLNCGFHIPISAGSAATGNGESEWDYLGANRLYCRVPPTITIGHYLNIYLKGRSWATNGPVISLIAEKNKDLGHQFELLGPNKEIDFTVGAKSPRPIDRLELIYNGEVARTFPGSATSDHILEAVKLPIPKGGWVAARVFEARESEGDPVRFAHTSPIYVNVQGTDPFDRETVQAFATQVTEDYNRFEKDETLTEREKSLFLEWYGFARDFYLEKLK
jgi:hypothetical protein